MAVAAVGLSVAMIQLDEAATARLLDRPLTIKPITLESVNLTAPRLWSKAVVPHLLALKWRLRPRLGGG